MTDPSKDKGGQKPKKVLLDSTQLDILSLRERKDGTISFERPWLTARIDADTHRIIGITISYDGHRSEM
jgi:hypothetical protein